MKISQKVNSFIVHSFFTNIWIQRVEEKPKLSSVRMNTLNLTDETKHLQARVSHFPGIFSLNSRVLSQFSKARTKARSQKRFSVYSSAISITLMQQLNSVGRLIIDIIFKFLLLRRKILRFLVFIKELLRNQEKNFFCSKIDS